MAAFNQPAETKAQEQCSTTATGPDMLLGISAELRNHVYHYILENCEISPNRIDYLHISTTAQSNFLSYQSLICACRQTRYELLPLLVKGRTISVRLRHITAFLDSVFGRFVLHADISSDIPVHIEIMMDPPNSTVSMEFDIAPLIIPVVNRRNFRMSFTTDEPECLTRVKHLNHVFSGDYQDAWKKACDTWLAKFELHEPSVRFRKFLRSNDLYVKKGYEAPDLTTLGFHERWAERGDRGYQGTCEWLRVPIFEDY